MTLAYMLPLTNHLQATGCIPCFLVGRDTACRKPTPCSPSNAASNTAALPNPSIGEIAAQQPPDKRHGMHPKRLPAGANFRYRDHDRAAGHDAQKRPDCPQVGCLDWSHEPKTLSPPHPAFLPLNSNSVRNGGSTDDFASRASSAENGAGSILHADLRLDIHRSWRRSQSARKARACRLTASLRIHPVAQFDEFQDQRLMCGAVLESIRCLPTPVRRLRFRQAD